jgi:hypothetical protein
MEGTFYYLIEVISWYFPERTKEDNGKLRLASTPPESRTESVAQPLHHTSRQFDFRSACLMRIRCLLKCMCFMSDRCSALHLEA